MAASAKVRTRRRRITGTQAQGGEEHATGVRLLEAGKGNRSVVELSCPKADNPLYRAFSALRALGVQIVHAEVKVSDRMVQRLYLMENDGSSLGPSRLSEVLVALSRARPLGIANAEPLVA
ncbi:MAG TPA: hypothetical protein VHC69_16130 [Polyangiaceae bacterium]|nr:hypothetical protein [Polyangiaceae bacterium]